MADGSTFVCYAREDATFVHTLAANLEARGIPTWLDTKIPPGADWDRAIDERLRSCARFLIVLSPAAVASTEVRGELRAALNLRKPIVPVLYQPCEIPRQLQNLQYVDLTAAGDRDTSAETIAATLASLPRDDAGPGHRAPAGRAQRIRADYLDDVKSEVAGRLAQSLNPGTLHVIKESRPEQVRRPWDADVMIAHLPRQPLARETRAIDVYDDEAISGRLLILGAPGSGKTIALLEIARELVARAETDDEAPLPVLCSLSSWRPSGDPFAVWLVDQLKIKYGVRKDNGRAWLEDRLLVPLLDGLDEVAPEDQERCVHAINQFQADSRPPHLVVCCRVAEYQNFGVKLQLHGAIHLLPLGDDQVRDYLVEAGCQGLWHTIATDSKSMALARSPLLLGIMTVAAAEMAPPEWLHLASASERQAHLFDVYIQRLLSDEAVRPYRKEKTLRWLAWLANMMKQHGQAEFLLEQLQPTSLTSAPARWLYRVGVGVTIAATLLAVVLLIRSLFAFVPDGPISSGFTEFMREASGNVFWERRNDLILMGMAVASGLFLASRSRIRPIETLVWSPSRAWRRMVEDMRRAALVWLNRLAYVGILVGLVTGVLLSSGLAASSSASAPDLAQWSNVGAVASVVLLLLLAAIVALTLKPGAWLIGAWGTRRGTIDAAVSGLAFGAGSAVQLGPWIGAASGLALAVIHGLRGGSTLFPTGRAARALVVGLSAGAGISAIVWWAMGLRIGLIDWVKIGLAGGTGIALGVALFPGILSRLLRRHPPVQDAAGAGGSRAWSWRTTVLVAASLTLLAGAALGAVGQAYGLHVRGFTLAASIVGMGLSSGLAFCLLTLSIGAAIGGVMGGFIGALYGVLGGLTGPDIERRTRPNQGIRQTAANIGVFAALGALTVGLPYGVFNLAGGALFTRSLPSSLDWLNLALFPALVFGVLGGLVPGAACIQHFGLRFVLFCAGLAPLRYVRFLNYATERMLLQRVGGRYRFIHDLLRDHFAGILPNQDAGAAREETRSADRGILGSR